MRARNSAKLIRTIKSRASLFNIYGSLSIGSLVNAVFPFRIGELIRAFILGKRLKLSKSAMLVCVAVERTVDCIVLSLSTILCIVFFSIRLDSFALVSPLLIFPLFLLLTGGIMVGSIYIVYSENINLIKAINYFVSIFNTKIRTKLKYAIWSVIHAVNIVIKRVDIKNYILNVIVMWGVYLTAVVIVFDKIFSVNLLQLLSLSTLTHTKSLLNQTELDGNFLSHIFTQLHTQHHSPQIFADASALLVVILFLPAVILGLIFVALFIKYSFDKDYERNDPYLNKLHRSVDISPEFSNFLDEYFLGETLSRKINVFENKENHSIIRTFAGGSKATTYLLSYPDSRKIVRKLTLLPHAEKLKEQCLWLKEHSELKSNIPTVINEKLEDSFYYYDIEFFENSETFFNFIHSNKVEESFQIIVEMIEFLDTHVYKDPQRGDFREKLNQYILDKTITKINDSADLCHPIRELLKFEKIVINGVEYLNFNQVINKIFEDENICYELSHYLEVQIHGDLTVENILVNNNENSFILLDPNNENTVSSIATDMGKLYQSLHSGYEFFCRLENVTIKGNSVFYMDNISNKYKELFERINHYLEKKFDDRTFRTIIFHEAVHYCRLLTYRAQLTPHLAPGFYAVAVKLFNDYLSLFYGNKMSLEKS